MFLHIFSCDSSSIGGNVGLSVDLSATSFMEILCCCQCINVVTVVVDYDIRTFYLRQQLYKPQCRSVGQLVCPQRVLQKCYAVGSVYMLSLLLQLRLLDHFIVILHFYLWQQLYRLHRQFVGLSVHNNFFLKCYAVVSV